ncbi:MAG: glycosyl hydrolase family 18 protein [Cyclobacteriaceae bacterium]
MDNNVFINYWIGEEPTGPGQSPRLNEMPDCVDIVPLAFVGIDEQYNLTFDFLTQQNSADTIKGWINDIRSRGIRVLLSINSQKFASIPDANAFASQVAEAVQDWGVDGVDIDFEPPSQSDTLLTVLEALRDTLGPDALMTSPIYSPWAWYTSDYMHKFSSYLNYVTTMDYTGYPGYNSTISLLDKYSGLLDSPDKLVVGISCMEPPNNVTPLDDVPKLCQYQPNGNKLGGAMLYTYSYDIETRPKGGTGYPNGTYTKTIHEALKGVPEAMK